MIESRDENHRSAAKCLQVARRIVSKRYLRYSSLIFARFQAVFDSFSTPSYELIQQLLRPRISIKLVKRRDRWSFDSRGIVHRVDESLANRKPKPILPNNVLREFAKTKVLITFISRTRFSIVLNKLEIISKFTYFPSNTLLTLLTTKCIANKFYILMKDSRNLVA